MSEYIYLDGSRTLYDLNGNPVWFLPAKDGMEIRDMKITPQGTITYLNGSDIYDVNYDGNILWKGPNTSVVNGDSIEHYHHEFTRLSNGHYMVLGYKKLGASANKTSDSANAIITDAIPYGH